MTPTVKVFILIVLLGLTNPTSVAAQREEWSGLIPLKSARLGDARLIESLTAIKSEEASLVIDLLRAEVSKHTNSRGFIIVYCGKVCRYGEIEAHLRGIELSLRFKGVNMERFAVISGGYKEKTTTEFWLVPEKSCPLIQSSILPAEVKFKCIYGKRIVDYECCY